ncbi:MarR family winged helix-turn-helix transcriptional regulator [Cryobacterium sp.]|jgi:DNA-binding MarR family transcriptional regulator|uniref:MarR family winged helix-turn-helix transcriptional regulator n=1 Tax=Cryobacterium sp. TaxID=1926290 RepID=UPI0026041827|nr:MarR family winged helix-turn-helix transcriptional regulator [Cryobacterium sp.]MCU1447438.1 MarR family transcriptional regulator [Cryobacterium sp.]
MAYSVQNAGTHYWYSDDAQRERSVAVLEAMRTYRAAESAMRSRTQRSMGLGENDILALRYLLTAKQDGRSIGPKELTAYLGISSASTTVLIDRLQNAGQVRREHSPFDRRALILVPTASTAEEIQAALGDVPARMVDVADRLDPAQAKVVVDFLNSMRAAVDEIDAHVATDDPPARLS